MMRSLLFTLFLITTIGAFAQRPTSAPYKVEDIAVNGSHIWTIAHSDQNGTGVYQLSAGKWSYYGMEQAMTISTSRNNEPIVVTHAGDVLIFKGRDWQLIGSRAELVVGSHRDGSILAFKNGQVQFFKNGQWNVQRVGPLSMQDMAQDRSGLLLAVNRAGSVYQERGGRWVVINGITGSRIDVGENGNVYIISDDFETDGNKIYQLRGNQIVPTKFRGRHIVTDAGGKVYLVDGYGRLIRHSGSRVQTLTLNKINTGGGQQGPFTYGPDVNAIDSLTGETSLFQAVKNNDLNGLYTLLSKKSPINKQNKKGETPLIQAIKLGHTDVALSLIDLRADYYIRDKKKMDALDYAIKTVNLPVLEALVRHGIKVPAGLLGDVIAFDIHPADRMAITAQLLNAGAPVKAQHLEVAAQANDFPTFAMLGDAAIMQRIPVDFNRFLPIAIANDNPEMVHHCVFHGADPNPGLAYAADRNLKELAVLSLESGANPEPALGMAVRNDDRQLYNDLLRKYKASPDVALEVSTYENHRSFIDKALLSGANPNAGMFAAVDTDNLEILNLLLSKGADARHPDLIAVSSGRGQMEMVMILLGKGADANDGTLPAVEAGQLAVLDTLLKTADAKRPELIETAAARGDDQIALLLLNKGADPTTGMLNAVDNGHASTVQLFIANGGVTTDPALIASAAEQGDMEVAPMLIEAGAQAQNGIFNAVIRNHLSMAEYLIANGATVEDGEMIHNAVKKNRIDMTKLLIANGAPLTTTDIKKNNLLHHAARNESFAMSGLLLDTKQVPIDGINAAGHTPLMLVVMSGRGDEIDLTALYVDHGADVDARDFNLKPVYKLAKGRKIKKYLKKNGAVKK